MRVIVLFALLLLALGQVLEVADTCQLYEPDGLRCQICIDGLQLNNQGTCALYTPIEGCEVYNATTNGATCARCASRYFQTEGGICLRMIDNCLATNDPNTCDQCDEGFVLQRYSNCYSTNVDNCPLGTLPRTANGSSFCQRYNLINCVALAVGGRSCEACEGGYSLINGVCFSVTNELPCPGNSCLCQGYYFQDTCYSVELSNCLAAQNQVYCDVCGNFYYDNRGVCIRFIRNDDVNCNVQTPDRTRCAGCNLGYFLNSNFKCVKNFNLCPTGCASCPSGFENINNNCYYSDPFCQVYDFDQSACILCLEGYIVGGRDGLCVKEVTCLRRDASNVCVECFAGYQLNFATLQCEQLPPNCVQMNMNTKQCTQCSELTINVTNSCVYSTQHCQTYNNQGYCDACLPGFVQIVRDCLPVAQNCLEFVAEDRSRCQVCEAGYHLYNTKCYPDIEGCDIYSTFDQCAQCQPDYLLQAGQCYLRDGNCLGQDSQGRCISCKNGFIPWEDRCVYYDPYCLKYEKGGNNRVICSEGIGSFGVGDFSEAQGFNYNAFVLGAQRQASSGGGGGAGGGSGSGSGSGTGSGGAGGASGSGAGGSGGGSGSGAGGSGSGGGSSSSGGGSAGGSSGSSSGGSSSSSSGGSGGGSSGGSSGGSAGGSGGASGGGSYNSRGQILSLPYAGISSPLIASYGFNGQILSCTSGYTLFNRNQCVRSASNCAQYNQYGACQRCEPGYDMIAGNQCQLRSTATCAQSTGGVCLRAASGYSLANGAAYFNGANVGRMSAEGRVLAAAGGYFVWGSANLAWPYDYNCKRQNEPGQCLQCKSDALSVVNGQCILLREHCQAYSPQGLCQGCNTGYLLWGGYCRPANCANVDFTTGYCITCNNGFTLSLGQCVFEFRANCQIYNNDGSCRFCQTNYYLTNGGLCAQNNIENCLRSNGQTGRCLECIYGYTMYRERCIRSIEQCRVYVASLDACQTCNTLYYPVKQNKECAYLGYYCAKRNDNLNCTECNRGLTPLVQDGQTICVLPIDNCFSYDERIKCVQCDSGFVLQFNRCKSIRCADFNFTTSTCMRCYPPYNLVNGSCIDPNCLNPVLERCLVCAPGFYLDGTLCVRIPDPNCLNYTATGCRLCAQNFTLNANGLCVFNDVIYNGCRTRQYPCPQCQVGYILNGSLCWARRCSSWKSNRDCVDCINYYKFDPSQRFCVLYTCNRPECFESDGPPSGFFNNRGWLNITDCIRYNGANCAQCQGYRFANPNVRYNLCYPYNCRVNTLWNCSGNCLQYYSPTPQYTGACLPDNCASIDSTGKCLQCLPQFTLVSGYCVTFTIPFCVQVDFQNLRCRACLPGYQLISGYCRAGGCQVYQSSNRTLCDQCSNGYLLTSDFICRPGKCRRVSPTNPLACQQCLIGYSPQGDICYANNCTTFDWASMECRVCMRYFDLVSGVGICRANNCNSFNEQLICQSCFNTTGRVYQLQPGGICVAVDSNCVRFDAQGNCLECSPSDRFVPVGKTCVARVVGCKTYTERGCTECFPAFDFQGGLCRVKHCLNYTTPDRCFRCRNRFTLTSGATCRPMNCLDFFNEEWRCRQCQPRFQLVDNSFCYTRNCSSPLTPQYQCLTCAPGFTLVGQTCIISNCPESYEFTCPACVEGFIEWNGVCRVPPGTCGQYDPQTLVCLTCPPGFERTSLGTCTRSNRDPFCAAYDPQTSACIRCLPNFDLNRLSGQCESSYCTRFSSSQPVFGRTCTQCRNGFILDATNRYCTPYYCAQYVLTSGRCTSCIGGTELSNGICYAQNCRTYSREYPISPLCQNCLTGYSITNDNLCQPENCRTINQDFECITCDTNFILNRDLICVSSVCPDGYVFQNFNCVPANCQRYNLTSNRCQECITGFVFENSSCIADNCIRYSGLYVCEGCRPGYNLTLVNGRYLCVLSVTPVCPSGTYLQGGQCVPIPINNCSIVDSTGQNCLRCLPGYFLRDGICYWLDGCDRLSFIYGCYTCLPGYRLTGFLCVFMHCATINQNNNTCASCPSGYFLSGGICRESIYKCAQTNSQGRCVRCESGFDLTNGFCVATGCAAYNPSTFVCFRCLDGFRLEGEVCVRRITLPNCFRPRNETYCQMCDTGYIALQGRCFIQIQHCLAYNDLNGFCTSCLPEEYYLNFQGRCGRLPEFCLAANPRGQCQRCVVGYQPSNGVCTIMTPNCERFNQTSGVCRTCISGYYLNTNNQCIRIPQNCTTVNSQGHCLTCISGFSLAGTICVRTIAFCLIYNQNNVDQCFQCRDGYYLDTLYRCPKLPPYCQTANNLGSCLTCRPGFDEYTDPRTGVKFCVQRGGNCLEWQPALPLAPRCVTCAQGYLLTANFTCSSLPDNCLSANSLGQCTRCVANYIPVGGRCVREIDLCTEYSPSTLRCVACQNGYYLARNSGGSLSCESLPRFCLTADFFGHCKTCLPGYIVYNNLCVLRESILNCRAYDLATFTCLDCLPGYRLNQNNICVSLPPNCASVNSNGLCVACAPGYTLTGTTCTLNIRFCADYDSTTGFCLRCETGYELDSDRRSCVRQVQNCQTFDSLGRCAVCSGGFFLIQGFCYRLPVGCGRLNNDRICVACLSGYELVGNLCIRRVPFCLQYGSNGCSRCVNRYYLQNGQCISYPTGCFDFSTNLLRCVRCIDGYTLNPATFVCTQNNVIANCANYSPDGRCLSCLSRYYLRSNSCIAYPPFCVNVDFGGSCLSCAFGSELRNGRCVATDGRGLFCLNYNTFESVCVACMTGYTYCSVAAICVAIDPSCQTLRSDRSCAVCKQQYTLYKGQCLISPPGVLQAPNGRVSCRNGYYLKNNTCFKSESTLTAISDLRSFVEVTYSSNAPNSEPFFDTNTYWSPLTTRLNQFISIKPRDGQPQIIFQLATKGKSDGWVSGYIIQFKNRVDAPFICWNGCGEVIGNNNGQEESVLEFYHPIIASEVRLYPVRWQGRINMQVEIWVQQYQ